MSKTVKTNTTYKEVTDIVNELHKHYGAGGLKQVYFTACGGSLGGVAPMHCIIESEAKSIQASIITANEFVHATPKQVDSNALVVTMSSKGGTPETIAAAKRAKELGATVITLSTNPHNSMEAAGDYHITYGFKDCPYSQTSNALIVWLGFEILKQFENYEHADKAESAFDILDDICDKAFADSAEPARDFAEHYKDEEQLYVVGSGNSSFVAYTTCICHLMEMEWIHSGYINAGELFHGPFEVAQPNVPFIVLMNGGPTRKMDERAVKFLKKYSNKVIVLDACEYGVERFDPAISEFFNSMILSVVARQYTETLGVAKKHPFGYRRYMFKVAY